MVVKKIYAWVGVRPGKKNRSVMWSEKKSAHLKVFKGDSGSLTFQQLTDLGYCSVGMMLSN